MLDIKIKRQKTEGQTLNVYKNSDVPLFGYNTKNINPDTVLDIVDIGNTIPENNPSYNEHELVNSCVGNSGEYILPFRFRGHPSGSLIVTDRSTEQKNYAYSVPLYYEYQLMYDHYSEDPLTPEGFMVIRRNNDTLVDQGEYKVERRDNPVISGRYSDYTSSGMTWGVTSSGQISTVRILFPTREENDFFTIEYNRHQGGSTAEYWSELLSERQLYQQDRDYTITASSILLADNSLIPSGAPLYVQKDPDSYVKVRYPVGRSDDYKTSEWNISVRLGNFVIPSGLLGDGQTIYECQNDSSVNLNVLNEVGQIVAPNIIRISHWPFITPSSTLPSPGYAFTDVIEKVMVGSLDLTSKITSIDQRFGYIMLNQELKPVDNIKLDYIPDQTKTMVMKNIQLSPIYTEDITTNSGLFDVSKHGLGIAIVPSGTEFLDVDGYTYNPQSGFTNIAVYQLDVSGYLGDYSNSTSGFAASAFNIDASDPFNNQPISGIIPSGSKMLGAVSINLSPKENVELLDIRRSSGYDADDTISATSGWRGFSDIGYWDGEPMPTAGTVIIQMPSGMYQNIYNIFEKDNIII